MTSWKAQAFAHASLSAPPWLNPTVQCCLAHLRWAHMLLKAPRLHCCPSLLAFLRSWLLRRATGSSVAVFFEQQHKLHTLALKDHPMMTVHQISCQDDGWFHPGLRAWYTTPRTILICHFWKSRPFQLMSRGSKISMLYL